MILPYLLFSQQDSIILMGDMTESMESRDSVKAFIQDSIQRYGQKIQDSIKAVRPSSGIDTVVTYNGKDSVVFNINSKKMALHGNAQIVLKQQKLEAEYIELDFQKNTMFAQGLEDSVKGLIGFPKFTESGEQYAGQKILYNFKTNKGVIDLGETDLGEGFYFGSKIKRISQNEMFVQNGYYTTCDAPHPHYYFGSPEMKVIVKDRILLDPITFYVEDMPLFTIPFGLFFPNKGGRQSGILIPSFFFSENRGVVLENFGIYLALSDYYDTKITCNFYSKGGYIAKTFTQWHLLNQFSGSLRFEFGRTRMNVEDPYQKQYSIGLNHSHQFNPSSKMDVRLDFRSQDYNRSTSTSINEQIQQNITSNASYQLKFDKGISFSIGYQRDQNIITNE
jgi:lipopolysaccharide assembly outer membrane protein LptD (OstA)